MTTPTMALADLAERGADADLLREMAQYVAQHMMEMDVEGRCGAAFGERSPRAHEQSQWLPGPAAGDAHWHGRLEDPEAAIGEFTFPRSGAASDCGESTCGGDPGSLRAGPVDALGRPAGESDGYERHLYEPILAPVRRDRRTFLNRPIEVDWPYLWIDAT
jgi:putative transposase